MKSMVSSIMASFRFLPNFFTAALACSLDGILIRRFSFCFLLWLTCLRVPLWSRSCNSSSFSKIKQKVLNRVFRCCAHWAYCTLPRIHLTCFPVLSVTVDTSSKGMYIQAELRPQPEPLLMHNPLRVIGRPRIPKRQWGHGGYMRVLLRQ